MTTSPKITVLMPVYNSELYIKEAVDSILNQTFSDFEFIIIDDASTDKSVEIIQSYSDSRIQLIIKPQNSGYTNSLNYGLGIAKGEYIARMDSDDFSFATRFEKQIQFLDHNKDVVVCGTNYQYMNTDIVIYPPNNNEEIKVNLLNNSCIAHPTAMIRKSVLDVNAIFYDTTKETAEDYDLWIKLLKYGQLHNLQEVLFFYRLHEAQVSNIKQDKQTKIANICRLSLLNKINIDFNENERNVFNKVYYKNTILSFRELKTALQFKQKIISKNNVTNYFSEKFLLVHLDKFDQKNIYNYFFDRKTYTPILILHFFQIIFQIKYQLKTKQTFNFFIKSIIGYKIK